MFTWSCFRCFPSCVHLFPLFFSGRGHLCGCRGSHFTYQMEPSKFYILSENTRFEYILYFKDDFYHKFISYFIVSTHKKQELLISGKHFKTTPGKFNMPVPSDKCRIKLLHIIICENNQPFPSKVVVPELNKFIIKISEKSLLT